MGQIHIRTGLTRPTPAPGSWGWWWQWWWTFPTLQLLRAGLLLCVWRGWLRQRHSQHCCPRGLSFNWFIKSKYYFSLQANMKVHSAGCLEVVSYHMRENITTLVGLVVATLFIQVNIYVALNISTILSLIINHIRIWVALQFVGFVFSFCLANSIKKECEIVWISVFEQRRTELMKTLLSTK